MKKIIFLFISMLTLSSFTACSQKDNSIITSLGIVNSEFSILEEFDTHGGFHGDGDAFYIFEFESDISQQLSNNSKWNSLPLSEEVNMLVYGYEDETTSAGPYTKDRNSGETVFPKITNGYYYFLDIQNTINEDYIFGKIYLNFDVAIYDSDENKLYFYEFDS
ncbi:MAG: hypothetical protein R3Y35_13405 [Clostridia bacterium]